MARSTLVLRRRRSARRSNPSPATNVILTTFALASVGAIGYGVYKILKKPDPSLATLAWGQTPNKLPSDPVNPDDELNS